MAAIEVNELRKSYGDVEAVRGVSFAVERGEVFGLLGPNGAGKTTTVEILEGYRRKGAGEVSVLGFDPGRAERAFRERIGVVLQESELWPVLTVREIHRMFAGYYRRPRVGLGEVLHGLAHGRARVEAAALQDDPDPLLQAAVAALGIPPEHPHLAPGAAPVALEDLDRRGLAGPVRPEQAEHLPALDGEGDAAHGLHVAVRLAQVCHLDGRAHEGRG